MKNTILYNDTLCNTKKDVILLSMRKVEICGEPRNPIITPTPTGSESESGSELRVRKFSESESELLVSKFSESESRSGSELLVRKYSESDRS